MSFFDLSYVLLWCLVTFETLVLILVLREIGILYLARREAFSRDGPPVDRRLPVLVAHATDGSPRSLEDLTQPYTVLIFGAFGCQFCGPSVQMVERWGARLREVGAVLLAEEPDHVEDFEEFADISADLWLLEKGEMLRRYGVRASPYAVVIDQERRTLAKGIASNHRDIKRLLREAFTHAEVESAPEPEALALSR